MVRGWGGGVCSLLCLVGLLVAYMKRAEGEEIVLPPGRGAIVGTVLDASNARPVIGATVQIVGDEDLQARTDLDGQFTLFVPPGSYRVRVSAPLYGQVTLENVTVNEAKSTQADASLKPRLQSNVEVVEVTADVTESTEATQLLKRKMAPTVSDSLGAESISKTPDSDAAEIVTRVPAVTIKDGKFIIVRGLGERYSSALLNGSRLPSTDPNRRIVPLDIFPADFIESLNIIKTYTPDLPGDFSGGLVEIKVAEPPAQLTYDANLSLGFNTETTFQDYDTYKGFAADWFTLGNLPRDLPPIFGQLFPGDRGDPLTTTQMRTLVSSLPLNWNIHSATAPPNLSLDGSVGATYGPFGFNLAAAYGWKFQEHRDEVLNGFGSALEVETGDGQIFTYNRSTFETQLGAVLSTLYKYSTDHKFEGRALVNRKSTDEVLDGSGTDFVNRPDQQQFATSSIYTADQLGLGQLEGAHHFSWVDLDWRTSWAPSSEDQPDAKYYIYRREIDSTAPPILGTAGAFAPQRTYTNLNEFLQDYYLDAIVPFKTVLPFTDVWKGLAAQGKAGLNYTLRDRSFEFQAFRNEEKGPQGQLDYTLPPDSLLISPNYSTNGPLVFNRNFREPFDASQEIAAGYAMVELPIVRDQLRFVGGVRVEYSYLTTSARLRTVGFIDTILNDLNPLPGVSLIYTPREDMNIRAAYSQTVSRPEFRELTPTQFPTLPGERTLQGNPFLISANITNYDLRWEWFLSPLELVSASFFYKDLENPIELVTAVETSNLIDTFVNYDSAFLYGFEMEVRKDFNFAVPYARRISWLRQVAPALADLQLLVNVSYIESETSEEFTEPPGFTIAPVPGTKPLQGQSPYVINAALEYEHYKWGIFRLLYNTVGPTIVAKGTDVTPGSPTGILPDIIQQRRDQLDFVWLGEVSVFDIPLTTKFAAENMLNSVYRQTQGPQETNRFYNGVTFSVGVAYSF
jgi:TonB dependent receptor-like, beta-barrel/Carboxypeptidase regulatory-like domain/TonB-dependent Receptor Plug Domain